jgi:hypothetical protein
MAPPSMLDSVVNGRATDPDPRRQRACSRSLESPATGQILCDEELGQPGAQERHYRLLEPDVDRDRDRRGQREQPRDQALYAPMICALSR